jgi:hypothetical protein
MLIDLRLILGKLLDYRHFYNLDMELLKTGGFIMLNVWIMGHHLD